MKIEIAGPGCSRCVAAEKNVIEAIKQLGIQAEVTHIYDVAEFAKKGVMFTPAVIVDGKIEIAGEVPSVDEAKAILMTRK